MSHPIRADFNRTYLLPPSVEDWVDAIIRRFIRDFVSSLDFSVLGFVEAGRPVQERIGRVVAAGGGVD